MRVMCITHENFHGIEREANIPYPEIGETVTVIGEGVFAGVVDCYILQEYKSPSWIMEWGYDKRNFAILPDKTADEIEEEQFIYEPFSC